MRGTSILAYIHLAGNEHGSRESLVMLLLVCLAREREADREKEKENTDNHDHHNTFCMRPLHLLHCKHLIYCHNMNTLLLVQMFLEHKNITNNIS